MLSDFDRAALARAIALAQKGLYTTTPNPRVGCVIVKNGATIGEGWHRRSGEAHAEVIALQQAAASGAGNTAGATVYVSLEPCAHHGKTPPCAAALIAARPARVVIALPDANPLVSGRGASALREAGIAVDIAAPDSPERQAALRLNIGFISRMRRERPWLRLKIAATLDGKTALESGLSRWISGEEARRDAHHLRAASCAVLTGIGTARQDNPALTARDVDTPRQPLRVLVDSHLRARADMKLFADENILVATAQPMPMDVKPGALPIPPASVLSLPDAAGKVDLPALMSALAERGVNDLLVEAGRRLNGALLAAGLVDEIIVYLAGRVFGENGMDMFQLPPGAAPVTPQDAPAFARSELTGYENGDIKIVYQRRESIAQCQ